MASERTAERDVDDHCAVELVRERVDLEVVHLVRVELLQPLALLRSRRAGDHGLELAQPRFRHLRGELQGAQAAVL